jgi:hypothetical protein
MWFRPLFSGRLLCDLFSPQRHKAHNGLKYIGSGFRVSGLPPAVSKSSKFDPPLADKCLLAFGELDVGSVFAKKATPDKCSTFFFITKEPKNETTKNCSKHFVFFRFRVFVIGF